MDIRGDSRSPTELRPIRFERGINRYAEGSALVHWGNTVVHCTATIEDKVPPFLRGSGGGWLTAEYSMLPRATHQRTQREITRGKLNARGSEIQRLIGRSLRAAVDLSVLGERTIVLDCDVLQADGGTRTACITGGFIALVDALRFLYREGRVESFPLRRQVAGVSVGRFKGACLLDLCYEEDKDAEVDANMIMVDTGELVEVQMTGEQGTFSLPELNEILGLGWCGIQKLHQLQKQSLCLSQEEEDLFEHCLSKR